MVSCQKCNCEFCSLMFINIFNHLTFSSINPNKNVSFADYFSDDWASGRQLASWNTNSFKVLSRKLSVKSSTFLSQKEPRYGTKEPTTLLPISPANFRTASVSPNARIRFMCDFVHVSTEGPLRCSASVHNNMCRDFCRNLWISDVANFLHNIVFGFVCSSGKKKKCSVSDNLKCIIICAVINTFDFELFCFRIWQYFGLATN